MEQAFVKHCEAVEGMLSKLDTVELRNNIAKGTKTTNNQLLLLFNQYKDVIDITRGCFRSYQSHFSPHEVFFKIIEE